MDAAPPPTLESPPSISQAVTEHLNLVHELREFRVALTALASTVSRLVEAQTVDRLTLGGLEKQMLQLHTRSDAIGTNVLKLCHHLGVTLGG